MPQPTGLLNNMDDISNSISVLDHHLTAYSSVLISVGLNQNSCGRLGHNSVVIADLPPTYLWAFWELRIHKVFQTNGIYAQDLNKRN